MQGRALVARRPLLAHCPSGLSAVLVGGMKEMPHTENRLIIRTDFSNEAAWEEIVAQLRDPLEPYTFEMEFVEERAYQGDSVEQVLAALPKDYPHTFFAIIDQTTVSQSDHPVLIVDLYEERGAVFRAVPSEVAFVDNNLADGNMIWADFNEGMDEDGIFRGLPEM
jgi:hypothetical protein